MNILLLHERERIIECPLWTSHVSYKDTSNPINGSFSEIASCLQFWVQSFSRFSAGSVEMTPQNGLLVSFLLLIFFSPWLSILLFECYQSGNRIPCCLIFLATEKDTSNSRNIFLAERKVRISMSDIFLSILCCCIQFVLMIIDILLCMIQKTIKLDKKNSQE